MLLGGRMLTLNAMFVESWPSLIPRGLVLSPTQLQKGGEGAARDLLGCYLLSTIGGEVVGGKIVETEVYLGSRDPASHAAERIGRTTRNAPMFGPAGTAYVYFIYGMHWCLNVVTGEEGDPQAVLVRAIEPEFGCEVIRRRRRRDRDLTNGPARLCQALGINGSLNGHRFGQDPLFLIGGDPTGTEQIGVSGRIGVRRADDWPLRFFLRGHADVSHGKAAEPASQAMLP